MRGYPRPAGAPVIAGVAHLFYAERRILNSEALAGYFFGVVAALLAVTIAT